LTVCARAVNAGHQNRCGDVGINNLKFRVGQQARHVKRADSVADRYDLVAVAAEQVDVLVQPRSRCSDIPGARRPGVGGREPVAHSHANHSMARGKAHRRIPQWGLHIRPHFDRKTFPGHEQQDRTWNSLVGVGATGCDVEHVLVASAISQLPRKRHALAGFSFVRGGGLWSWIVGVKSDFHDIGWLLRRRLGAADRGTHKARQQQTE
jgi:hypothetical protein